MSADILSNPPQRMLCMSPCVKTFVPFFASKCETLPDEGSEVIVGINLLFYREVKGKVCLKQVMGNHHICDDSMEPVYVNTVAQSLCGELGMSRIKMHVGGCDIHCHIITVTLLKHRALPVIPHWQFALEDTDYSIIWDVLYSVSHTAQIFSQRRNLLFVVEVMCSYVGHHIYIVYIII